jgi:two-component system, chemotaxis family, protein-glutamate methylesterase/glutaminase
MSKRIIVIGASAGGLPVITKIISKIDENINAALFIVLHLSKNSSPGVIVQLLKKNTKLQCAIAQNGTIVQKGTIYLAPPEHHLALKNDRMLLSNGPHENRWRPSIDVLFRSAAAAHNTRVIGIILTGLLHDGTAGMTAIKRSGGICIVQEPAEAEFNAMPRSVINHVEVDYRLSVNDIPYVLHDLCMNPMPDEIEAPEDIRIEAEITERMSSNIGSLPKIGNHSNYTCPDCGGNLWEINKDKIYRYRCHTGHVFTETLLLEKQSDLLEDSVWAAIRLMEERRNLLLTFAGHEKESGDENSFALNKEKADEFHTHITRLKNVVIALKEQPPEINKK